MFHVQSVTGLTLHKFYLGLFLVLAFIGICLPACAQVEQEDTFAHLKDLIQRKEYDAFYSLFDSLTDVENLTSNDWVKCLDVQSLYYRFKGNLDSFKVTTQAALDTVNVKLDSTHELVSPLYFRLISNTMFADFEYSEKMRKRWRCYIDNHKDSIGENNYLRALGNSEALKGNIGTAVEHYEKSLTDAVFYYENERMSTYLNLAYFYGVMSNSVGQRMMNDLAIRFGESMKYVDHPNLTISYMNNADMTFTQSKSVADFEKVLDLCERSMHHAKLDESIGAIGTGLEMQMTTHLMLATTENQRYHESIAFACLDSIRVIQAALDKDKNRGKYILVYRSLGKMVDYFLKIKNAEKADFYLNEYLTYALAEDPVGSLAYARMGKVAMLNENYDQAIEYLTHAFCMEHPSYEICDSNKKSNQPNIRLAQRNILELSEALFAKYDAELKDEILSASVEAMATYDSMTHSLHQVNAGPHIDYSLSADIFYRVYSDRGEKDCVDEVLKNIEKHKNYSLIADFDLQQALDESAMPDSIQNRVLELRNELAHRKAVCERFVQDEESESSTAQIAYLRAYSDYLSYQKKLRDSFSIDQFEERFVAVTRENILEQLSTNDNLVIYTFGINNVYCIFINHREVKFLKLSKTKEEFDDLVRRLNRQIDSRSDTYSKTARELYDALILPLSPFIDGELLTIMPDEILHKLPFDLLLDSTNHYLIETNGVRYINSLLQLTPSDTTVSEDENVIAFAASPSMSAFNQSNRDSLRAGLGYLPAAVKELNNLKRLYVGQFFTDDDATETMFKKACEHGSVIHLAMHGLVNSFSPINSSLLFNQESDLNNDGYLRASEIAGLDLHANLVTLSACNSGAGDLPSKAIADRGHGIQSLSNGFLLAGAKSVVASLWPVHDQSSYEIMKVFYAELENGIPKYEALRRAKLSFLENQPSVKRHPYYWGGFVYVGDGGTLRLEERTGYGLTWVFMAVLLVLLLTWYLRRMMLVKSAK